MKSFTLIMMLMFTALSQAEGFKSEQQIREFSDNFIDQMIAKEFKKGLNSVKPYWPIPAVEIDGLANQIVQQWPIVDQRFGQAIEKEFVKEKRIGKSFIRYYYLHKFEKHSMYWQLDFYKPKDKWVVNTIIYLDSLETLYE